MAKNRDSQDDTPTIKPLGIKSIDRLSELEKCSLQDYISAVSEYVRISRNLDDSAKKIAQIRLSTGLARALLVDLRVSLPNLNAFAGEKEVSGALRNVKADLSEMHPLDGLRLAAELKPVNLAVGRAIWNRFGDVRTFAVNLHLKFPFAVIGGVLTIPTYEEKPKKTSGLTRISTRHLIERAVARFVRAGGRKSEGDPAHLLEGIAVIAYDPDSSEIDSSLPQAGIGLRWNEFVTSLVTAYQARFED
ncbi:MAG TPA: hypothetical protein VJN43_01385 [Bryobacteraceae bacterium]|nr:hypothetical protein [Bryobacteraceae bacterium]